MSQEVSSGKRTEFIDIARGIAMIAIVLGHLGISSINCVVFTFHLPIFFLIAGYYLRSSISFPEFVKQKIRSLLVPYYITCILIILFAILFEETINQGVDAKVTVIRWLLASLYAAGDAYEKPFTIYSIGALWFLWAMFWALLMMRGLTRVKWWQRLIAVIALFYFGQRTRKPLFWFPLSFQAGCTALLYVYIGWLLKTYKSKWWGENSRLKKQGVKEAATILALIVWVQFVLNFKSFWMVHSDTGRGWIDIFGSLCGCLLLVELSMLIERYRIGIKAILMILGRYSLLVLSAHIIELNTFPWWMISNLVLGWGGSENAATVVIVLLKFAWIANFMFIVFNCEFLRKLYQCKEFSWASFGITFPKLSTPREIRNLEEP